MDDEFDPNLEEDFPSGKLPRGMHLSGSADDDDLLKDSEADDEDSEENDYSDDDEDSDDEI